MRGLEQARYQAQRSFKRRIDEKETLNPAIIAKVGNGAGTVVVLGRPGWIYVRLHGDDNQLTEAKLGIPLDTGSLNDAWVRVRKASPRKASYYVVQEFVTSSTGDPAPPMSAHPLDPDGGPHTGTLPEAKVEFDDSTGHDHAGSGGKGKKISHPDLLGVTADQHHLKIHAPAHKSGGEQPLDVKELVDSEGRLLTGVQKADLTDGGLTVLHQHAGGATASVLITLTNRTGGQRTAGDVVVTDPDDDESFVGTAAVGYQGKVLVVGETIADLTGGLCWERGGPFDVKVTGAVDRNDGLRTSATIYRAAAAPSLTGTGVFAIALSPNISGEGTIKAVFLDAIGGGGGGVGGGSEVAGCHVISYPVSNETLNEGNTYTSGDLRDGTYVPVDAVGVWLMLHGKASVSAKVLAVDSADDIPDSYSSRLMSQAANTSNAGLTMVRLGTGENAGKIKIKAITGNWISIYAWPVGYWK